MENFTFFNPTRIEFGADKEQLIGQHLARHGVRKVLLCYGSERIKRDGLFDVVTQRLAEQGIAFVELGGIESRLALTTARGGQILDHKCATVTPSFRKQVPSIGEGRDRLSKRVAAHAEHDRELALGRQPFARLDDAEPNRLQQPLHRLFVGVAGAHGAAQKLDAVTRLGHDIS